MSYQDEELDAIIPNGYAVQYIIAQKMVQKSNEDGYLIGSRGSVGSSFAANMAGITEINPLPAHYLCPECHYTDFDSPEVKAYVGRCGLDMPDRVCPMCGTPMQKMGLDIPYEIFLGLRVNKEPDIDLNFAGEYQEQAFRNAEEILGEGHTFHAGTIATLSDRTAYGYVKKYFEDKGIHKRSCEIERIASGCAGGRRTTGRHPGGIIVLPHGEDINSFTPVQHPANDMNSNIIITHFDYHSIDLNLLKLDILGHDDPTMIRMMEDITDTNARKISLYDPRVMGLFKSTDALETKPAFFSDLIRISGLSHGTDVWRDNAETLIREGTADITSVIGTRDDIMIYLIGKGLEREQAFCIMENVRKGKGLKPKWEEEMCRHDVPEWYIRSCKKIKYLFQKAHAAAYVMMAYRIAWYKVYYPLAFYAAYFSIRADQDIYRMIRFSAEHIKERINDYEAEYEAFGGSIMKRRLGDLYVAREMYARGFPFAEYDPELAAEDRFAIIDGRLMPPKVFAEYAET